MAKVMVSFPDDLLERFDAHARDLGKSRSGLLQELAEREMCRDTDERRRAILESLAAVTAPFGGDGADLVRRSRDAR